jgi:hypothetical protein
LSSSNSDALVSFGAGTKDVFVTQPAERAVYVLGAGTGLAAGAAAFTSGGVPYADSTSTLATGSALTFDGTNLLVGGTSVYSATMTSYATASRSGGLGIRNSAGTAAGGIYTGAAGSGGGSTDVYVEGVGLLGFITGGSEQMRLTSTGLGIGTSSPASKLDVNGTISVGGLSSVTSRFFGYSGSYAAIQIGAPSSNNGNVALGVNVNAVAGGAFNGQNQVILPNNGALFVNAAGTDFIGAIRRDSSNRILLGPTNASGLTAGDVVIDTGGNVGIGTSSPARKLDIYDATAPTFSLHNATSGTGASDGFLLFTLGPDVTLLNYESGYIGFSTAATERMRLDSSGNLGLGVTPSAWGGLRGLQNGRASLAGQSSEGAWLTNNAFYNGTNWVYMTSSQATMYQQLSGVQSWHVAGSGTAGNAISWTQAMTLDASGNLGVGTTSPSVASGLGIVVNGGAGQARIALKNTNTGDASTDGFQLAVDTSSNAYIDQRENAALIFTTNNAERARITSGGYSKFSNDGTYVNAAGSYHEFRSNEATNFCVDIGSTSASFTAGGVVLIRANRNTTNNTFYALSYYNDAAGAFKFRVADSGDVTNTNGTYGTISDAKMKADIVDAGSQWADIKALRFRKFKMKDDPSGLVQLGVVAQEVELTSPGLVDEHQDRDAEGNDLGTTTKSVKTSVLLMKAAVALQEAMSRIEALEAQVAQLKGA